MRTLYSSRIDLSFTVRPPCFEPFVIGYGKWRTFLFETPSERDDFGRRMEFCGLPTVGTNIDHVMSVGDAVNTALRELRAARLEYEQHLALPARANP